MREGDLARARGLARGEAPAPTTDPRARYLAEAERRRADEAAREASAAHAPAAVPLAPETIGPGAVNAGTPVLDVQAAVRAAVASRDPQRMRDLARTLEAAARLHAGAKA
jgi:hypothetical protein